MPRLTLLRYLAREIALPCVWTLGIFTLVVVSQDLLGWADLAMHRGLGGRIVGRIAFYETLPQVARTLPFAVLVGTLAGLGRLGADHELLALEASGVSALRLLRSLSACAALATLVSLSLSLFGAPAASRALERTLDDVARHEPSAAIQANRANRFGTWRLEAREVSERGHRMRGVLLWIPGLGATVFAERGSLEATPERATQLTLENAVVLRDPRVVAQRIAFERLTTLLPETGLRAREESAQIAGQTLRELAAASSDAGAAPDARRHARVELLRRYSLGGATLCFGLLALPLLLSRRRLSRSGGVVQGILATIAYYGLVQLGNGLIEGGELGAAAGVWLPNLAVCALAAALLWRVVRAPSYGRPTPPARRRTLREVLRLGREAAESAPRRFVLLRYVARRFLALAALGFAALLVAYLLVDLLEHLEFFARFGATPEEVALYYAARIPLLAARIVPMSLLLAAALCVSLFGSENELLGMQVSGVPALRAMLPVLLFSALAAPFSFGLNERIVPRAMERWHYVKNVVIKGRSEPVSDTAVWYRIGDHVYEADTLSPELGSAHDVVIYRLGPNGLPLARTDARSARYLGRGLWSLEDPIGVEVVDSAVRYTTPRPIAELGERVPEDVETTELSGLELRAEIAELEQAGYDATPLRVDYYAKLATPLACLVLPGLALFFAVGGAPTPGPALTLVFGMGVAVAYVLLVGAAASLGYAGLIPPWLAGLGPTLLLGLLAAALAARDPLSRR